MALLVEKLVLTEKEGEALAKALNNAILPGDYKEARGTLKRILKNL